MALTPLVPHSVPDMRSLIRLVSRRVCGPALSSKWNLMEYCLSGLLEGQLPDGCSCPGRVLVLAEQQVPLLSRIDLDHSFTIPVESVYMRAIKKDLEVLFLQQRGLFQDEDGLHSAFYADYTHQSGAAPDGVPAVPDLTRLKAKNAAAYGSLPSMAAYGFLISLSSDRDMLFFLSMLLSRGGMASAPLVVAEQPAAVDVLELKSLAGLIREGRMFFGTRGARLHTEGNMLTIRQEFTASMNLFTTESSSKTIPLAKMSYELRLDVRQCMAGKSVPDFELSGMEVYSYVKKC